MVGTLPPTTLERETHNLVPSPERPITSTISLRPLALIAALALAARFGYLIGFMRGYAPNSDAGNYYEIGRAVSKGLGYSFLLPFDFVHATAIRPPLYPTVLAGAFRVFGAHVGVAQGVNVTAGCGVVVLGALIGQRISGRRAGLCAGIVLALYPPLIANDVTVLVESIAVLLLFATVLLLLDGRTVLAGISIGLLMLDRASAQWFVLVIAGWALWHFGWRHAVRMVVVALLVVSPWVIRNAVQVGGPVLVATNGFNLNATYSNEARHSGGFVDAYYDPRFATTRNAAEDEVDLDSRLRANAMRDLGSHPTEIVHVVWMNARHWFELPPSLNGHAEELDGRNLPARHWTLPVFYVVTLAGLYALMRARRNAGAQLLALATTYFTVVSLATIAVPRLRSLCDGGLAICAGVTVAWWIDRRATFRDALPKGLRVRAVRSTAILAVIAVVFATVGMAWRADTRQHARRIVVTALTRDGPAMDAIVGQYRSSRSTNAPPRLVPEDVDRLRDLLTVLGNEAPKVATNLRPQVVDALHDVRISLHEADVISLLSLGEYLIEATAQHRTASLDYVRARYEREVRPGDATLEPWDAVMSGAALLRARSAVNALDQLAEPRHT